jgi:murein DD-endopeptidase MepM/ murein hydrolase activator NlpD
LEENTGDSFAYCMGDYDGDKVPDLYCIARRGGSGTTEVHVLSGRHPSEFLLHTATALGRTDGTWQFYLLDFDHNGSQDLAAVCASNGASGHVEIHILNGSDGFQSFLLHQATPLAADKNHDFQFSMGDFDGNGDSDLIAVRTRRTGTRSLEAHVAGGPGFSSCLLQTGTPMSEVGDNFRFLSMDLTGDGRAELIGVKMSGCGTGSMEIHALDAADNYQRFVLQTPAQPLAQSNDRNYDRFSFVPVSYQGFQSIAMVLRNGTGSHATELHIFSVAKPAAARTSTAMSSALYGENGGRITCGYDGYRFTTGRHEGIDFSMYRGHCVRFLTDGVITRVSQGSSNALSTVCVYNAAMNKTVVYLHTAPLSSLYAGLTVRRGEQLGYESNRGASASHTHVELRSGRRTAAAVSHDSLLENENPYSFWESLSYSIQ